MFQLHDINSSLLKENHKQEEADGSSEYPNGSADLHTFSVVWAYLQQALQSFSSVPVSTYAADQLFLCSYSFKTQRAFIF